MRDWEKEAETHSARQAKVRERLAQQHERVDASGGLDDQDSTHQTLNEMRQNKASVDINRAMFDYDEAHKKDGG